MSGPGHEPAEACLKCPSRYGQLQKLGIRVDGADHVVALAGNPNTGKTTVFNVLTGLRMHTGNWPGKTIAREEGAFSYDGRRFKVVDLPGTPVRALAFAVRLPLWLSKPLLARAAGGGRGGKMPSFHIDLHSGRGKSEVDYLHGAVVRAGKRTNVPTPVNQLLTETLLALTNGEIPLEEYAHQPKKLLSKL